MKWFLLFFLLVIPSDLLSAQPIALSLEECVRQGLVHSHTLKISELQARIAESRLRDARRARFLSITGIGSYRRLSSNIPDYEILLPEMLPGFPTEGGLFVQPAILNQYNLRLRVDQPLFQGLRLEANQRAAVHGLEAARHYYSDAVNELNYAIQHAYWKVHESMALLDVLNVALELVEAQLQLVTDRNKQGMALRSDVLALQTRRSEVRLQRVEAQHLVAVSQLQLNFIMGTPLDQRIQPTTPIETEVPIPAMDELLSNALSIHPSLQAREEELATQSALLRVAKSRYFPQISLSGLYDYARPNTYFFPQEDVFNGTWEAGVTVTVDLWNWGRTQAKIREARASVNTYREQLINTRRSVELDIRSRLLELERSREAVRVIEQGVEEAREGYRIVTDRYQEGVALNTEVLDAELALRTAETSHVQALVAFVLAKADALRAAGSLTNP